MRHWSRLSAALAALLLLCAVPARGQSVGSPGTISTAGSDCSVATRCWGFKAEGVAAFGVGLNTGTSGTFNFEISTTASSVYDDTGDWTAVKDAENGATSGTADGIYFFGNTGFRWFRVRASAINGAAGLNANRGYVPLRSTATLTGGGSNAAASTTGSAVPSSAGYTAINVGGTLRGWTGLSLGSHYVPMIAISDGAGSQITSFGGGTQYQTAAAQATPTGTLALGYDGANLRHLLTNGSGHLNVIFPSAQAVTGPLTDAQLRATAVPVSLASVPSHAVTNAGTFAVQAAQSGGWTVTANAGTNLNTSALLTGATFSGVFGPAGTPNASTLTVQGATNMTPVQVQSGGSDLPTFTQAGDMVAALNDIAGAVNTNRMDINVAKIGGADPTPDLSFDFHTGGTVQNGPAVGLAFATASGAVMAPGDATDGLRVQSRDVGACYVGSGTGSTASTNATNCASAAAKFFGGRFINTSTTIAYLRLYNLSSSPTCSSSTGFIETIPVPPAASAGQAGGWVDISSMGVPYGTGLGFCITGGGANNDNTNAPAGVFGVLRYRS